MNKWLLYPFFRPHFWFFTNTHMDRVEPAPAELRTTMGQAADDALYMAHAGDSGWLFHHSPEGWKTLGHDF